MCGLSGLSDSHGEEQGPWLGLPWSCFSFSGVRRLIVQRMHCAGSRTPRGVRRLSRIPELPGGHRRGRGIHVHWDNPVSPEVVVDGLNPLTMSHMLRAMRDAMR